MSQLVKTKALFITRDAATKLLIAPAIYEESILKKVHGTNNVVAGSQTTPNLTISSTDEEIGRLLSKYGEAQIIAAYGSNYETTLAEAIEDAAPTQAG